MMRFVVPLLAAMGATVAASAQEWGQVSTPTAGPPQSIGFYTAGCLQGAQALPLDGPGYEVIRISRNRYWGQPVTLDFIKTLSEKVRAAGQAPLYIGDIGQPRGGPAVSGHANSRRNLLVGRHPRRRSGRNRRTPLLGGDERDLSETAAGITLSLFEPMGTRSQPEK